VLNALLRRDELALQIADLRALSAFAATE